MTSPAARRAVVYSLMHRLITLSMVAAGFCYTLVGISWIIAPSASRIDGIAWLELILPVLASTDIVGILWIMAGACAIMGAVYEPMNRIGWGALIGYPATLAVYFLVAWLEYMLAPGGSGASTGWVTSVSYLIFAGWAYGGARMSILLGGLVREDE